MNLPLVSIVLPTYNGSKYLAQSIESCIAQTYPNWELILVDDASTDDTPRIIERYVSADPRIRSVRHEVNRRLPAGLNTGFAQARGQYLTWTSDDNYFAPDALTMLVAFLNNHTNIDFVFSNYYTIDETGAVIQMNRAGPLELLAEDNCVGSCFLYRRSVYEALGGYRHDAMLAEDYDYWLRASLHFRLAHLDYPLYFYRIHASSLSGQHMRQGKMMEVVLAVQRRVLGKHVLRNRRPLGRSHVKRAHYFMRLDNTDAARRAILWGILFTPSILLDRSQLILLAQIMFGKETIQTLANFKAALCNPS